MQTASADHRVTVCPYKVAENGGILVTLVARHRKCAPMAAQIHPHPILTRPLLVSNRGLGRRDWQLRPQLGSIFRADY